MGFEPIRLALHPWTEHESGDERRHARTDVDNGAPGEVDGAEVAKPSAFTPDPVRDRRIDQERPEQAEENKRLEPLPLGKGTGDERRCDDGEHHLEGHVGRARNRGGVLREWLHTDAAEADVVEPADEAADVEAVGEREAHRVAAERQSEPEQDPRDADQGQDEDAVHDRAEHILAANQAAVEEGQPGRHEHYERSRGQDPGGIARVDAACGIWHE